VSTLDDASKATLGEVIRRTSSWIDANADAATEEWEEKRGELEAVADPLLRGTIQ